MSASPPLIVNNPINMERPTDRDTDFCKLLEIKRIPLSSKNVNGLVIRLYN